MKINPIVSLFILFILVINLDNLAAQSKFEYGVGIGINHSSISEDIRTNLGSAEDVSKGLRLFSVYTRVGYKFSDPFHLNSGLGFSWLGSMMKDLSSRTIATTFEMPLQLEWNVRENIQVSSGPIYNYVIALSTESEDRNFDVISTIDSRHQFGLRHGIAYSHKLVELSLNYSHYFTNVFNLPVTDVNGNDIGSYVGKFRNIQIGITFRG